MRVVHIRVAKGLPSEAEQRAALVERGAEPGEMAAAWVDTGKPKPGQPRQRDYLHGALREGDEVWVSQLAVIGASDADILGFLIAVTEAGAALYVASTGRRYRWHPDAADTLRLMREAKAEERALVMAKARAGIRRRRETLFTPEQWEKAEQLWRDRRETAKGVSKASGIGVRRLYDRFGPRGTPAFGRPFKGKGKA